MRYAVRGSFPRPNHTENLRFIEYSQIGGQDGRTFTFCRGMLYRWYWYLKVNCKQRMLLSRKRWIGRSVDEEKSKYINRHPEKDSYFRNQCIMPERQNRIALVLRHGLIFGRATIGQICHREVLARLLFPQTHFHRRWQREEWFFRKNHSFLKRYG